MKTNRIVAGVLSAVLLALLVWCLVAGVGDRSTQVMLAAGAAIGLTYASYGRVPRWLIDRSGGSLTDDDDPGNLPARVYLPILLGVIAIAAGTFAMFMLFL